MLPCGAFHAHAARNEAICLALVEAHALLLTIALDVAVDRFLLQAGDRARAEGMAFAEHLLHVFVRDRLIFAGEVQVDIRRFIALEAKEYLKGDLIAELFVFCAAHRAVRIRHVHTAGIFCAVHIKIAVLAVRANVMRLQRVHLRDARHCSHKRGADRATRADEVTVRIGFVHEPLRKQIQRCIAVADDGIEFLFQARLHHLRQRISVDLMGSFFRHAAQFLVCPFKRGRIRSLFRKERLEPVAGIRDRVRVRDDDLKRLFLAQVGELLEHFLRRFEIQRRLLFRILEIPCAHEDSAVDRILRVQEMHVPRGDDGNAQLIAERHDLPVQVAQPFFILHRFVADEERVIADGLDLQVVVFLRDLHKLFVRFIRQHGMEKLARFTG